MPSTSTGPEWPRDLLNVEELRRSGWRPRPPRQFVLKIHSRCNLACSYCYVYTLADAGWRDQPLVMGRSTVEHTIDRIARHARIHRLEAVDVVLHGGEPLLAGAGFIADLATGLRRAVAPPTEVRIAVQTNAVLVRSDLLGMFAEHDIRVGVSLDGPAATNDQHRRFADGRGSHAEVERALRLLGTEAYRQLFSGLLCTVDLKSDPIALYEELLRYDPPSVDILLPHGNWTTPPPGRTPTAGTPYADWLIPLFERWYSAPVQETTIRFFAEIVNLVLGGASRTEAVGLSPIGLLVVETDGSIEQVDTLKSAYHGAAATGLNVFEHDFDEALNRPALAARQLGVDALADECRACPVGRVCGGGYYPHRYRAGSGFRNPSVYCPDLMKLVGHIATRVHADVIGLRRAAQC
jgi:uncharacterized protein